MVWKRGRWDFPQIVESTMNTTNSQNAVLCTFSIPTNPTGFLSAPCPDYLYDCKFSAQYRRNKTKDDDFKLLVYGSPSAVMD